jgi:hypothetical protein
MKAQINLRKNKSGQAIIEYILGLALVAGVVFGILFPIMRDRFEEIQNTIVTRASRVMAQDRLGIPYSWFFGGEDASFDKAGARIQSASNSMGGADPNAAPNSTGSGDNTGPGNRGSGGSDGAGTGDSGGASGGGGGVANSRLRAGTSRSGGTAGGEEGEEDAGGAQGAAAQDRRSRTTSGSGGTFSGSTEGSEGREKPKPIGAEGETVADEDGSGGITGIKRTDGENERARRGQGGCGDVNIFTLLKIAAIVLILLLMGAVALSGKGNKAKN